MPVIVPQARAHATRESWSTAALKSAREHDFETGGEALPDVKLYQHLHSRPAVLDELPWVEARLTGSLLSGGINDECDPTPITSAQLE